MKVWVGTSGYSYSDWVGDFYPPGTSAKRMLGEYAQVFPITELNFTFYRLPTAPMLARQAKQTPASFQFAVKLFRGFTHERDLAGADSFRDAVAVLHEEGRLSALLAQFPQSFHYSQKALDYLEALAAPFADYPLAIEFRHQSWARPEVADWFRERGLHLVSVDVPTIPALFPTGLVLSGRLVYLRLHSRRAEAWYQGEKERYDYLYSDAELLEWLDALRNLQEPADRALVLFNNCYRGQAAQNARRLQELLKTMDRDGLEVVPAPEAELRDGEQRLLF